MRTIGASQARCPHCETEVTAAAEFCTSCSKILPVSREESYFEVLGYDRELLQIDPADLEKRFFQLSKKFHPDRFASKSAFEIQLSHDRSSAVNNAYRTLKNPVTRAKYMVERKLGSIEEKSATVPPDMADFFFEVHDSLDEIRESNGNPPEHLVREVQQAEKQLADKVRRLEQDLETRFTEYDSVGDVKILEQIKQILAERSYIKSFLRQVDSVLKGEEDSPQRR